MSEKLGHSNLDESSKAICSDRAWAQGVGGKTKSLVNLSEGENG